MGHKIWQCAGTICGLVILSASLEELSDNCFTISTHNHGDDSCASFSCLGECEETCSAAWNTIPAGGHQSTHCPLFNSDTDVINFGCKLPTERRIPPLSKMKWDLSLSVLPFVQPVLNKLWSGCLRERDPRSQVLEKKKPAGNSSGSIYGGKLDFCVGMDSSSGLKEQRGGGQDKEVRRLGSGKNWHSVDASRFWRKSLSDLRKIIPWFFFIPNYCFILCHVSASVTSEPLQQVQICQS